MNAGVIKFFLVVCINLMHQRLYKVFVKFFFSPINFLKPKSFFHKALSLRSNRRREKKFTAPFMSGVRFYSRSFLLWSFQIWYNVNGNTCYMFSPLILLHCYGQVATFFTFILNFFVQLFFHRRP